MPTLETRSLGPVAYSDEDVIEFPEGLPGFEDQRRFLLVLRPESAPVYFLQSLDTPALLFVTVPVTAIDPEYDLKILADYYPLLGWEAGPEEPENLQVLAIVYLPEFGRATGNLLGPVVIDPVRRRGVQAIRDDARYSAATPIPGGPAGPAEAVSPCS